LKKLIIKKIKKIKWGKKESEVNVSFLFFFLKYNQQRVMKMCENAARIIDASTPVSRGGSWNIEGQN
jgi:hypothetical protein